ncbi:MAG: nuclear transport factor 2 family protein [Bacteroidota bacterium]
MRLYFSILVFSTLACHTGQISEASDNLPIDSEEEAVLVVVHQFLAAGDAQSSDQLESILHPTYRILINQFQGGPDVTILDRVTYLGMIEAKKIGGDPRKAEILSAEVVGNMAFVRARVESSTLQFNTCYTLVQDTDQKWWLAAEAPFVQPL